MATVQILDGGRDEHDDMISQLEKMGLEVLPMIADLYKAPEQLRRLPDINPDYIYIRSVGMMEHQPARDILRDEFYDLGWIPDNIIFFDEGSAMTFLEIARKCAGVGTKAWFAPFLLDNEPELRRISWI